VNNIIFTFLKHFLFQLAERLGHLAPFSALRHWTRSLFRGWVAKRQDKAMDSQQKQKSHI